MNTRTIHTHAHTHIRTHAHTPREVERGQHLGFMGWTGGTQGESRAPSRPHTGKSVAGAGAVSVRDRTASLGPSG